MTSDSKDYQMASIPAMQEDPNPGSIDNKRDEESLPNPIAPEFQYHNLNSRGIGRCNFVSHEFTRLLTALKIVCPEGREFSLVKTKLEEACMFAKKAISKDGNNQGEVEMNALELGKAARQAGIVK